MRVGTGAVALAAMLLSGTAWGADIQVTMSGEAYSPSTLKAKVGDRLVFDNNDGENHAVFIPTVGHGVDLGTQKPGEKRMLTLRRAGTIDVECVLHEDMKMTVEVTQ